MVAHRKHSFTNENRPRSYVAWVEMRRRIRNPRRAVYVGLTIDPSWNEYEQFVTDMGEPPDGYSLDRVDNTKGYGPSNCRWADATTQQRNTSRRLPPFGIAYARGMRELMSQRDIAKVLGCGQNLVKTIQLGQHSYGKA